MNKKRALKKIEDIKNIDELAALRNSINVDDIHKETLTYGDKIADRVADRAGSWGFIITFVVIIIVWIIINSIRFLFPSFDPYPFILLNLVLSCLAALQAPVIMMSQNRQESKDRIRAEHDYEINLKAEIIIEEVLKRLKNLDEHQHEIINCMQNKDRI